MTPDQIVQIIREALMCAFWLSLPLLGIGFVIGIVMSLIQTLTSIQDSAFSTVPRMIAFLGVLLAILPWLVMRSMSYTLNLFSDLGRYAR